MDNLNLEIASHSGKAIFEQDFREGFPSPYKTHGRGKTER